MASQWGGDGSRRGQRFGGGSAPTGSDGAHAVAEWAGCDYHQLNRWCAAGLLGERHRSVGSGARRRFTPGDFEVVAVLVELAAVGALHRHMAAAVERVSVRPVAAGGEVLVVFPDGRALRFDKHACLEPGTEPCWVVTLRPAPSRNEIAPTADTARAI